jgi:hypothetical protein
VQPSTYVDAGPVRERIEKLLATPTWGTVANLSAASGLDITGIQMIRRPGHRSHVLISTAKAISKVTPDLLCRKAVMFPAQASKQRVMCLQAQGWTLKHLSQRCGVGESTLRTIGSGKRQTVFRHVAEAIEAVYEQIGDTCGPSTKSAQRARAGGWLPGRFYDDDGNLVPEWIPDADLAKVKAPWATLERHTRAVLGRKRSGRATKAAERIEVIRLSLAGVVMNEIAERMGFDSKIVNRYRREVGLQFVYNDVTGLSEPRPACKARAEDVRAILNGHFDAYGDADPFVTARRMGMMRDHKWNFDDLGVRTAKELDDRDRLAALWGVLLTMHAKYASGADHSGSVSPGTEPTAAAA